MNTTDPQISFAEAARLLAEWLHDNYPREDVDDMDRWDATADEILRPALANAR